METRLPFHSKPSIRFPRGKWSGMVTPYRFNIKKDGGWRISFGASGFLVAEGSGFSRQHGLKMFRTLESEWLNRPKKKRA